MLDMLIGIAAIIGAGTVLILLYGYILNIIDDIVHTIRLKKQSLAFKKKFKIPPTAKCYCGECIHWNTETHLCYNSKINNRACIHEGCFCYWGEKITVIRKDI